ncbi:hypothetical protein I4F81_008897 [Pyropia yezoensis]|uniref:Uncharacterized protein n=1 Tax=Pyropia yezoensis TaxID=2788 RepID=A0ACC3C861_PYRYE|nr:hypothetical protein I4F81_008897 [Neopyropia yezoensis]
MDNPTDAAAAQTRATVGPSPPPPRARPPPSRRPHVTDLVLAAVVRAAATVGRMDVDVAPRTAPAEPVPRRAVAAGTPPPPPLHHVAANGGATTNAPPPPLPLSSFLSPPLVRRWTSPLPVLGVTVTTVDQPGRWMGDADLAALAATLRTVAVASMGTVPSHRLFARGDAAREVLANRVVAVAVDTASGAPADGGFVSAYKVEACNRWCAATLNTAAGDEVFQVGRVDVRLALLDEEQLVHGAPIVSPSSRCNLLARGRTDASARQSLMHSADGRRAVSPRALLSPRRQPQFFLPT